MSKNEFNNYQFYLHEIWRQVSLFVLFSSLLFQSNLIFAAMTDGRWHAGIGDPTVFGWITVFFYLLAVLQCGFRAISLKKLGESYHFWLYLSVFLFLLGINKQLDLQSWFTQTLKDSAQANGWYEHRRPLQLMFITTLGVGMLISLIGLRLYLKNSWQENKLTWIGIVLLCTFILMRAASFHHLDIFINHHVLGLRINVILEIGSILLIILGAFVNKKAKTD